MQTKNTNRLRLLLTLMLLIMLIATSAQAKESCISALHLCGSTIVPSLFPFFVLSGFLTKLGLPQILGSVIAPLASRLYGISPAGASALIMGFVGGWALILFAKKLLGPLLQRDENYYDGGDGDE